MSEGSCFGTGSVLFELMLVVLLQNVAQQIVHDLRGGVERLQLAGQRPIAARPGCSHFGLFSHLERVVDLNAEIPDSTFQLCMAEQELYRPKILCPAVN